MRLVKIRNWFIGSGHPLVLISGPCVIETEELALTTASYLQRICHQMQIPLIYKSSYDKGNRSSVHSFRGPGLEKGLRILERVKREFDLPVLTDVHSPEEALAAGEVCEVVQIPAFLCRQTDLVTACARTGAVVNVKKGQFMAPWDMRNVIEKIEQAGNDQILLTERGTTFGYNNLVADLRSIIILQEMGYPVCFDASHSVMLPGARGTSSGGERRFLPTLAKAAVAAGCNCLFIESHPNPSEARSDKDTVFPLQELKGLLEYVKKIYEVVHV